MITPQDIRYAHEIIDTIADGKTPAHHELERLRRMLPEPPKQKTLEELRDEVYDMWIGANGNEWADDVHGDLETWLWEHHKQLEGLSSSSPKPSQHAPGLPEGMRLATHPEYGLCVVSPTTDEDGERRIFYLCNTTEAGADCRWVPVVHLKFLDAEEPSPEPLEGETPHPEFLEGEADYELAPEGTIAVYKKSVPFVKLCGTWRTLMLEDVTTAAEMGAIRRSILRWGFGNE